MLSDHTCIHGGRDKERIDLPYYNNSSSGHIPLLSSAVLSQTVPLPTLSDTQGCYEGSSNSVRTHTHITVVN